MVYTSLFLKKCSLFHNSYVFGSCIIHILYIYSTNVGTEYFKHGIYSPFFFSLQNAVCFIILTCLVPVLFTFYIQGVLKLKKNNSGAKRLRAKSAVVRCTLMAVVYAKWTASNPTFLVLEPQWIKCTERAKRLLVPPVYSLRGIRAYDELQMVWIRKTN